MKEDTPKLTGHVNWGTATVVGIFAGMLYGGSKEASASVVGLNSSTEILSSSQAGNICLWTNKTQGMDSRSLLALKINFSQADFSAYQHKLAPSNHAMISDS